VLGRVNFVFDSIPLLPIFLMHLQYLHLLLFKTSVQLTAPVAVGLILFWPSSKFPSTCLVLVPAETLSKAYQRMHHQKSIFSASQVGLPALSDKSASF
jgi:hypothetical protein